jgi:hypothetical protein
MDPVMTRETADALVDWAFAALTTQQVVVSVGK